MLRQREEHYGSITGHRKRETDMKTGAIDVGVGYRGIYAVSF